jgi:predicted nucleic acid-binding protein
MSAWVVDASVALKWVVAEEGSEAASGLAGEALSAPSLLLAECANALWVKARRGELDAEEAVDRLALLHQAPVRLVAIEVLTESAARLAFELDHSVYDCLYLALALQQECALITADRRLVRALARDRELAGRVRLLGESP